MRVSVVHNPTAGHGRYVLEELLVGLQRSGRPVHVCVCVDDVEGANFDHLLNDPGDAIVVAGGDGSVRRVARHIVGRGVPLAVVPLGTANNIARALNLPRDPALVIAQLNAMVPWKYDVGCITGPWWRNAFLE